MGPEMGCRTFDKLDFILFPSVLLLRVSLSFSALLKHLFRLLHCFYDYFFNQVSFCGVHHKVLSTILFLSYLAIKFAMFLLYWMHLLTAILLRLPFKLCQGLLFWPRLFYCLFNPHAPGRLVCQTLTDPEDCLSTPTKTKNLQSAIVIRPLWSKFLVFFTYQVHGAYAHLHQHTNEDVADALLDAAGSSIPRVWDPLCFAIPYQYLSAKVFKPPDCYIGRWITIILIIMIYMIPLCRGAVYLAYLWLFPLPPMARPCRRTRRTRQRTTLTMANQSERGHSTVTFNTDGIPFIVDNSGTCIITNEWSLFVGTLTNVNVKVDTIEATQVRQQYEGMIRLDLVDDFNVTHSYDIPGAIYDPSSKFNLLGIPKLADFFKDKDYLPGDDVDSDGTTVKSSGCRSRLTWDHGKHTCNFTHGYSTLPEIMLYQGHGYFDAFCTRLWRCYHKSVEFAFSSTFSISPSHVDAAAIILDGEDSDDEEAIHVAPTVRGTRNNGDESAEEDVDWFQPPPPLTSLLPPPLQYPAVTM